MSLLVLITDQGREVRLRQGSGEIHSIILCHYRAGCMLCNSAAGLESQVSACATHAQIVTCVSMTKPHLSRGAW